MPLRYVRKSPHPSPAYTTGPITHPNPLISLPAQLRFSPLLPQPSTQRRDAHSATATLHRLMQGSWHMFPTLPPKGPQTSPPVPHTRSGGSTLGHNPTRGFPDLPACPPHSGDSTAGHTPAQGSPELFSSPHTRGPHRPHILPPRQPHPLRPQTAPGTPCPAQRPGQALTAHSGARPRPDPPAAQRGQEGSSGPEPKRRDGGRLKYACAQASPTDCDSQDAAGQLRGRAGTRSL